MEEAANPEEQFPKVAGRAVNDPHIEIEVPRSASQGCWGPASVLVTPRLCRTCPERDKEVFSWLELGVARRSLLLLSESWLPAAGVRTNPATHTGMSPVGSLDPPAFLGISGEAQGQEEGQEGLSSGPGRQVKLGGG